MRAAGRWTVLALGALLLPTAGGTALLLETPFSSGTATLSWWSPADTEARTFRVLVRGVEGVTVQATTTSGLVQLHVFPWTEDAPGFRSDLVTRMDWIPAREKTRLLGAGEWLVAVDPSLPGTTGTARFTGTPGLDDATPTGAWRCPVYAVRGCRP